MAISTINIKVVLFIAKRKSVMIIAMDRFQISWLDLIKEHKFRYPNMTAHDVYKLLFQGILGPEHLIRNECEFRDHLLLELAPLVPDPNGCLFEAIQPGEYCFTHGKHLFRVHLRAWLYTGDDLDQLVQSCLSAVHYAWGAPEDFRAVWKLFCAELNEQEHQTAQEFIDWVEFNHYPAVHHSEIYRKAYSPAYRLIAL